jgi:hypothetical protein
MGKSTSKYIFTAVQKGVPNNIQSGVFIWMLNAHKRPPHFVMCIEGKVTGISVKGATTDKDVSVYLNLIESKNIPTLFIELKDLKYNQETIEVLKDHIELYPQVKIGGPTCLDPINSFIHNTTDVDVSGVEKIFDLLPLLEANHISSYSSVLLPVFDNEFHVDVYSREDIVNGILKVQKRYAVIGE